MFSLSLSSSFYYHASTTTYETKKLTKQACDGLILTCRSKTRKFVDVDCLGVFHSVSFLQVNLGSHQYLFTVQADPSEMPCLCVRHDVDALVWQPHPEQPSNMWEHVATFNALGKTRSNLSKSIKKSLTLNTLQ